MCRETELAAAQLRAIERMTAAHRTAVLAEGAINRTREMRLDAARRLAVIRREQATLIARAHEQLQHSAELRLRRPARLVVLAHRSPWFAGKVSSILQESNIDVMSTTNGADAVAITVAEQPDLVLVEDVLEMLRGEQVIREVQEFSPGVAIAGQVQSQDRVSALIDAGASSVFAHKVPPQAIAQQLLELVNA